MVSASTATGQKGDFLTMKIHFGMKPQLTTETREHSHDEKDCPRFTEKERGWV